MVQMYQIHWLSTTGAQVHNNGNNTEIQYSILLMLDNLLVTDMFQFPKKSMNLKYQMWHQPNIKSLHITLGTANVQNLTLINN